MQEQAARAVHLSREQSFPLWESMSLMLCGWGTVINGSGNLGITQLQDGLERFDATGGIVLRPYYLSMLAQAYAMTGEIETGLSYLAEAYELIQQNGERLWEAEVHRLYGELLQQQSVANAAEAERWLHQALKIARQQRAKSLELRAATCLAKWWQSQGERQAAYDLLAPVYEGFTEGFDTADLQDVATLLTALKP